MAYTWSTYVTALADLLVYEITDASSATPSSDTDFNNIIPSIITYAENRLYRELDLLQTRVTLTSLLTANVRSISIPAALIVVEGMNVITPFGVNPDASNAVRNPVQRASLDFINFVWPNGAATNDSPSVPKYYDSFDNSTAVVAPAPSLSYTAEFIGTVRPTPLSSTNTSTILTTYLPDLFMAASMIFATGFQRDFSAQSADPAMSMSWEAQYQLLKPSAVDEVQRMKSQGQSWMPFSDAPKATMQRGPQ